MYVCVDCRDNQLIQRLGRMQDELRARPNFHPLKNMMNNTISEHITLQAALLSPTLSQELLAFYDWTCSWILDLQELNDPSLGKVFLCVLLLGFVLCAVYVVFILLFYLEINK